MLSKKEILNAKEIYLSQHDEILIPIENRNVGYRFTKQSLSWEVTKRWYSWKVYCQELNGEEALEIMECWRINKEKEHLLLNTAIEFATKKHSNQVRKGTSIPYILHPLEVMQILCSMRADTNLMIAGVLHDTVEDTDTTLDEIKELFGEDVAHLVASNSEDKEKSWDERKQHTISELEKANIRVKMLVLADKLSNLRSIASDYENIGDKLWERFNAPKEKQAWYYSEIQDALYNIQDFPECEKMYWEFVGLFKDVFVKYYLDKNRQILYQVCITDDIFCFEREHLWWNDIDAPANSFSYDILDSLTPISRKQAEFLEDTWTEIYKI